jgi:transcriptional regulator
MFRRVIAKTRDEDIQVLEILYLRECCGWTAASVAHELGTTRNADIGHTNRIRTEHEQVACTCVKPENKDGGMPERWWAA